MCHTATATTRGGRKKPRIDIHYFSRWGHSRYSNGHLYCSQNNCLLLYSLDIVFILAATKPLLRQIENLQAAHSTQSANWEKVEANLTQRLGK